MPMIQHKQLHFLRLAFFFSLAIFIMISCSPAEQNDDQPVIKKLKTERKVHLGDKGIVEEVGHWSFDGNLIDLSGEDLDGTARDALTNDEIILNNDDYSTEAVAGLALKIEKHDNNNFGKFFIDLNDAEDSPLDFLNDDKFSISLWMKRGNGQRLIVMGRMSTSGSPDGSTAGWALHFREDTNRLHFKLRHSTNGLQLDVRTPANAIPVDPELDDSYYHYVATYNGNGDASGVEIYVNTVKQVKSVRNNLAGSIQTDVTTNIGSRDNNQGLFDGPFVGLLDEIYVFKGVLSQSQVNCLFHEKTDCMSSALLIWDQGGWDEKVWAPDEIPDELVWDYGKWYEKNWGF